MSKLKEALTTIPKTLILFHTVYPVVYMKDQQIYDL